MTRSPERGKDLQQIASENNISPELVRQWKKQAQEGGSLVH
ncbi:MAG: transposase [Akkermansia sp.]|nr:transposase [Akkermansia sp.]